MITPQQAQEMIERTERNRGRLPPQESSGQGVPAGEEIAKLHNPIIKWCNEQYPQVPFFYTRPDKPSGAMPGTPDFGLLYKRNLIVVECKTVDGKLSEDQQTWRHLCMMQGFKFHVVRTIEAFYELVCSQHLHHATREYRQPGYGYLWGT